jgi:nicotinamide-nucleotide amidase
MTAEIIAVGSELLTPHRLDTNSLFVTERLNAIGIEVRHKTVAGDDPEALGRALADALVRNYLVILTGGLGPTSDDITREVVAHHLALPLERDESVCEAIRRRFERRRMRMPDAVLRQAMVPRGSVVVSNPVGTAPGLWIETRGNALLLLPGPFREMSAVLEVAIERFLAARAGTARIFRRVLRVSGRSESHVEEIAQPVYSRWARAVPPVATTILASPGQVELRLSVRCDDAVRAASVLDEVSQALGEVLGADLYSADGRTLEQVVGDLLMERRLRLALAESCTGGLITSRLTDVPGSSGYVDRAVVCYGNKAKTELLGVPEAMLAEHGAVSEPVALSMAEGVRNGAGTDVGVAVTGIAGPGGGTEQKPVGTVVVAAVLGDKRLVQTHRFPGGREQVKMHASQAALSMVRRLLIGP